MKRRVLLVLLLLVAGAIANVAVAWGCTWRFERKLQRDNLSLYTWGHSGESVPTSATDCITLESIGWERTPDNDLVTYVVEHSDRHGPGSTVRFYSSLPRLRPDQLNPPPPPGPWGGLTVFGQLNQSGWPSTCAIACRLFDSDVFSTEVTVISGGVSLPWTYDGHDVGVMLPFRPLWPGFAINTVFYAVVLWRMFAAPFALRRRRRIRRGLCPKCAYDLRGTPEAAACPECGAAHQPPPHAVTAGDGDGLA